MDKKENPGKENNPDIINNPNKREIDLAAKDVYSWWNKAFVFVKKTEIRTWKAILSLAFIAGVTAAMLLSISFNIQNTSEAAANKVSYWVSYPDPVVEPIRIGENFNADILLNTNGNDVVSARAIINYNTQDFELTGVDTSNSIFAVGNECVYENKPCEIVKREDSIGRVSITMAKPTPGVDTGTNADARGVLATLNFKALRKSAPTSPNISIAFDSFRSYTDSDIIRDDENGTDILEVVDNATVAIHGPVCTDVEFTDWTPANCTTGEQTRTPRYDGTETPLGCEGIPAEDPDSELLLYSTERDCVACFEYSEWGTCQLVDGDYVQTRTISNKEGRADSCSAEEPESATQDCTPACTSVESTFDPTCKINPDSADPAKGLQDVITTTVPAVCTPTAEQIAAIPAKKECALPACKYTYTDGPCVAVGGKDPKQTQVAAIDGTDQCYGAPDPKTESCTGNPCTDVSYGECKGAPGETVGAKEVLSVTPSGCVIQESLECNAPACSYTYGACQANGTWTYTVASPFCVGEPVKTCDYVAPVPPKKDDDHKDKKKKKKSSKKKKSKVKDTVAPKLGYIPYVLNKGRGEKVWWNASDNVGIASYSFKFNGRTITQKGSSFNIPVKTSPGMYFLTISAFDKAGNKTSKTSIIKVR